MKAPKEKNESRPFLISGGFDPDCELCRALSDGNPDVFGDSIEGDMVEVREILGLVPKGEAGTR